MLVGDPKLANAHPPVGALLVGKVGRQVGKMNVHGEDPLATRPAGVSHPVGDWLDRWTDYMHEFDGHGIDSLGRTGLAS